MGLSTAEVEIRRGQHGLNSLSPPKSTPEFIKFLKQFTNPLMLLLLIAGVLCFMAYALQPPATKDTNNLILASALIIVVSLTCTMSYIQERSASNVMASLSRLLPSMCTVYRDGREQKVDATQLVPGDLVRLHLGDRVPADLRVLESVDLKVETSSLTGESDLVPATVDRKADQVEHARNILFMSTLCMNGEGRGIVIRTGDLTYIGCIASLAGGTTQHQSSLQREVQYLVKIVAIIAFSTAIALFAIGLGRNNVSRIDAFINGFILVIVANVPEGLPATVTSLLTLCAVRLKERNVLLKRIDIIENLGCASIIATDKTGTLTQNKMSVQNVWTNLELCKANTFQQRAHVSQAETPVRKDLQRNTLNRASRRILDVVSQRAAQGGTSMGPTLAAHSRTLGLTRSSAPVPPVPLDASLHPEASHQSALLPESTFENQIISRMSLGRKSRGTTSLGRIKTIYRRPVHLEPGLEPLVEAVPLIAPAHVPMQIADFNAPDQVLWNTANALTRMVVIGTVVNKARFLKEEDKGDHVAVPVEYGTTDDSARMAGDATDVGLLRYCDGLAPEHLVRQAFPILFSVPFNSATKFSLVVTPDPGNPTQHVVMVKGAPEILILKCSHYFNRGEQPMDDQFRSRMVAACERCGFQGQRIIGFAYKVVPSQDPAVYEEEMADRAQGGQTLTTDLIFMGLFSLMDPPKLGVPEAVARCRRAGIRVAMVTGDHQITAEAIARKVGIVTLKTQREVAAELGIPEDEVPFTHPQVGAVVVPGPVLKSIAHDDQDTWDQILDHEEVVFARTTPQQKLDIVEHLQRRGEVVAVTGDGVNDSPALAKAQIGVAMGNGSDVAREAADIVLLDDEFSSIVNAVEEGRIVFDNLKKTLAYTLTHALPELFPIFLNLALSFPLGLGGLMILTIDLITEQGPAISLAYEPAESMVMERPPRDIHTEKLVDRCLLTYAYGIAGVLQSLVCLLAFFSIFWWRGVPISYVAFGLDSNHWTKDAADLHLPNGSVLDREAQQHIWSEAQAAWYTTLVMQQFWHIFMCKTRAVSIFKHGLFRNAVTIYGLFVSISVVIFVVYIPELHHIFSSNTLSGIGWLPNLAFLIIMLPFTEWCKRTVRRYPVGWVARNIAW